MNEVDDRLDAELEQAPERAIGEVPIPSIACGLDAVPRHAVARRADAELGHEAEILLPALVMPGELVFVEGAAGEVPRLGNEGVLDPGRPPERVRLAEPGQLRALRQGFH